MTRDRMKGETRGEETERGDGGREEKREVRTQREETTDERS